MKLKEIKENITLIVRKEKRWDQYVNIKRLDSKYSIFFLSKADINRKKSGRIFQSIFTKNKRKSYKLKGFG
jgi:hypothetical protein